MNKIDNNTWLENESDEEEIIWVSKSELKRDAEALKKIGVELVALSKNALSKIPLDDELLTEIDLAKKTKREGLRRQMQLIGKLLRSRDIEPIQDALDKLKNKHNQHAAKLNKAEQWRKRLIQDGDPAVTEFLTAFPAADRQKLRTLLRAAQKDQQTEKSTKSFQILFQYIKEFLNEL